MSFTSTGFLIFIALIALINKITTKKYRWVTLLIASMAFYALGGAVAIIYILATSAVVFIATRLMQLLQDNCDKCIVALKNTNNNNSNVNNCVADKPCDTNKTFPTFDAQECPTQKSPDKKYIKK